jgi:hypothetical protein
MTPTTTKISHTPGPWTVEERPVLRTLIQPGICEMFGLGGTPMANARLIAAAPELYAIVRAYRDREDHTFAEKQTNWEAARGLLARIDGAPQLLMIRDDLDTLGLPDALERPYRFTPWRLWLLTVLIVLCTLAGLVLVFRWTSTPPEQQPYSAPLRTRPPARE